MKTFPKAFYFLLLFLILFSSTIYADGAPNNSCNGELISELNNKATTTSHTESGSVNENTDRDDYYYFNISQAGTISINYTSSRTTDLYFSKNGCGDDKILNNGIGRKTSLSVLAGQRVYIRVKAERENNTIYNMVLKFTPKFSDLSITKDVNNSNPKVGDRITYTIVGTNDGPDTTDVIIKDTLPASLAWYSDAENRGSFSCTNVGNDVTCQGSRNFASGDDVTVTIQADVLSAGIITNTATIESRNGRVDTNLTNNSANVDINATELSDLSITKDVDNPNPKIGDRITYTIVGTNNGPNTTDVIIKDTLPAGLAWYSDADDSGDFNCTNVGNDVTCQGSRDFDTGDDVTVTIQADVLSAGIITNTATIESSNGRVDTNLTNNSANVDLSVAELIGDYRFDACTLGTMIDDSGYGNNGALQNVESEDIYPKHEEKGMVCRAGRFYSFVANYATAGTSLQADVNGSFSIAFAIEWSGNHGDLPIITKEGDYALKINEGDLYYKLDVDAAYTLVPNFSISQNIASHVSFVVATSEVRVYKDGVLTDTIADVYTNPNNSSVTYIGTDNTNYFSGLLDEIKFYKGILDQTTITELSGRTLRPCACCVSSIKIKGDYLPISNTYDTSQPVWDSVTYDGFRFDEPPLLFMLPSDNGSHSAYIRAKNVTEIGFEAANIEPQGEDGPHIAMDLSYIAVSRGIHDLGEYTLEACTIPVQTEQLHDRGFTGDFNATNQTPYGTISCDANGCWTKITTNSTYIQPVVFATLITTENELRDEQDNASGRELSRPWMTVAIKNDASGIWVSLERSETTYGKITKPELVAYMITEGNIQSSFLDDFDNNVSYETIYIQDRFLGWNKKNDVDQRFDFNRTYQTNPKPLVMANKQSRKDVDGGWFRLNGAPKADHLKVSIWEDRRGSYNSEKNYDNPAVPETPIGVSANQDSERSRIVRDDGAAIVFGGVFQYAESFQPTAGNFDAVEAGANFNTILDTKIVNKPFQLKYWSLDQDNYGVPITKVINSPVKVDFIYSQNAGVNLECNATDNLVVPQSTKYAHFIQPNPYIDNVDYNITNSTAYRNVQARFTFGADENGTAVDWLVCYNNSGDCGDSIYTSTCTATCTADVASARSEACAECYFNNVPSHDIGYACSFDRFAIRPNAFDIAINGSTDDNQTLVAGTSFQVDANATGYNSTNASRDYNATQTSIGSLSQFRIAPTDLNAGSGCATGLIIDINDNNFTNGDFNDSNGKYTEVGDINITVFEDPNKIFASVDTGNTNASLDSAQSVYTIQSDSVRVAFIPDHFRIAANLRNESNGFTYMSRDLNVSASLDINITAENALNNTTTNYNSSCYAQPTTYAISYNNIAITPINNLSTVDFIETITSTNANVPINTNIVLANIANTIFPIANGGNANISIDINFDRDKNESVNPFEFTVQDVNITDANGTIGSIIGLNQTATFIYGRTHASKQRFIVPTDAPYRTNIYHEAYCFGVGCNKTLLPNGNASINTNDLRWWVNTLHNNAVDGNITINPVLEKGAINNVNETVRNMIAIPSITSVDLNYNQVAGFPYITIMENNASSWLIENEDNAAAVKNEFQVEFLNAGGEWSGKHETSTTTEDSNVDRTNRRSMW